MLKDTLDQQTALVVTALASALMRQSGINGELLRLDFLDILEGLAQSPEKVGSVGRVTADLMSAILEEQKRNAQPPP